MLGKLESPAVGPFQVLLPERRTVIINRDGMVEHVSADRVFYAPPPANAPSADPFLATEADIRDKVRTGPRYTVDRIEKHRVNNGTLEFLVKWIDYDEPTWEPRNFLPEELVWRYFASIRLAQDRHVSQ